MNTPVEIPEERVLDTKQIARILPHRYPFRLIDRVIKIDLENDRVVAQKNVTINEEFFQGHFPDMPIMPGVLVLEALAQTGGILAHEKGAKDKVAVLLNANNVKFRKPVHPGDVLFLHVEGLVFGSRAAKVKAYATINDINGRPAVEAEIGCALVERSQI